MLTDDNFADFGFYSITGVFESFDSLQVVVGYFIDDSSTFLKYLKIVNKRFVRL